MICVDSIESTRIDNILNPPSKSRSTIFSKSRTNQLPACRTDRRGNDSCRFDGIGFTNRFPVCRIANTKDESTLVECIGQPSYKRSPRTVKPKICGNLSFRTTLQLLPSKSMTSVLSSLASAQ